MPQQTSRELLDSILDLLQRKFYQGEAVSFVKDRSRLLAWVALWPASWLAEKGVTLPPDRYREIFTKVFLNAVAHGTSKVTYRPAYLREVIQSHFRIHGDEIYEEAKSVRSLVENALLFADRTSVLAAAAPKLDPVAELAAFKRLLKPNKRLVKGTSQNQSELF